MGDDVIADRGRPARERAQMQVARHALPVIDRIIVPEKRLAAELFGHAREMPGAELFRAHLFARPEDLNGAIEPPAEIFEIALGSFAEETIEHRIIGVIAPA